MATCFVTLLAVLSVLDFTAATPHPLSDEFIDLINSKQNAWQAGRNFRQDMYPEYIKRLAGALPDEDKANLPVREHHPDVIASLPDSFDPREKWTNCPSLNEIRDQGGCLLGDWAFAAASAMTDRYCIFSNGSKQVHISAEDLLSCCSVCGNCDNGFAEVPWYYWEEYGIVTGGNYNSSQGCRPYTPEPCEHYVHGNRTPCNYDTRTPYCVRKCVDSYDVSYEEDKNYGKNVAILKGENHMMAELYQNGPFGAEFGLYEDFLTYKSGVYIHTEGRMISAIRVKLMGWGVESGHKYWLLANSWNSDWGESGFFRMLRGEDHCGIESFATTGEPVL